MEMSNYIKITEADGTVEAHIGDFNVRIDGLGIIIQGNGGEENWYFARMASLEVSYSIMCVLEKELKGLQETYPDIKVSSPETDQINKEIEKRLAQGEI